MAEQEEDVQSPTQLRTFSIVSSPPQLKLQLLLCKQYELHPIGEPLVAVQCPPQFDIGPQPFPQEFTHTLVHIPEHVELPQSTPQSPKQPLVQLVKHQPEHPVEL